VNDEISRQRLIDIAGDNPHSWRVSLRDGLSFRHPSADEHVQPLEFRRALALFGDAVSLNTGPPFSGRVRGRDGVALRDAPASRNAGTWVASLAVYAQQKPTQEKPASNRIRPAMYT
jgi:hypothetical protein